MLLKKRQVIASDSLRVNKYKLTKSGADVEAEAQKIMRANLNKMQGKKDDAVAEESEYEDECHMHTEQDIEKQKSSYVPTNKIEAAIAEKKKHKNHMIKKIRERQQSILNEEINKALL